MFGFAIQHDVQELPDGSEVVRFVVSVTVKAQP